MTAMTTTAKIIVISHHIIRYMIKTDELQHNVRYSYITIIMVNYDVIRWQSHQLSSYH